MKITLFILPVLLLISGCLKQSFDAPPDTSNIDPGPPAGTTLISIAQLKNLNGAYNYTTGGDTTIINSDVCIAAVVTADDRSGNFYKAINVEDSSGGIQLAIDAYNLFNNYPAGRKIYVQCKGLTLGYNAGTPVLGMSVDETLTVQGIPGTQADAHIIKADVGHAIGPLAVTLAQLASSKPDRTLLNRLVVIQDAEFVDSTGAKPYAQPTGATNRDFKDCSGKKITLRTSNYAGFAAQILPVGKGAITGVFSIYTSPYNGSISPQLAIRDTSDVRFYEARCGGGNGGGGTTSNAAYISLDSLRNLYSSSNIKLGAYSIHGTVISDAASGNVTSGLIALQDGLRGISVFGLSGTFNLGDSLVIDVSGDSLLKYRGALEVKIVGGSAVSKAASNVPVILRTPTIADINASYADYEWTLVKIANASSPSAGTTYSGNKTLNDGTGNITLYTAASAAFAAQAVPSGAHNWAGIVSQYNSTKQLQLRNPASDVQ